MSGTAEQSATAVGRTKDGIPTWGGEANAFVQYEEAALLWEQSLTWEKRYTAGPKLVQELTGAAKRLVAGQPAGWVSFRGGVTTLMDHLRAALGKPRINEVTDLLATYFKGTKRRPQESMNDYITRKTEAYMRASQSLKRVQPHYEKMSVTSSGDRRPHQPRGSGDFTAWSWSRQWTPATDDHENTADGDGDGNTDASTQPPEQGDHSWWDGQPRHAGQRMELLPQFIQGWYLLADANLDSGERNLVMTALGGNFDPLRVAQELRNQFSEGDIRRRDTTRRHQSYLGEFMDDEDGDTEAYGEAANMDFQAEGMSEEGVAMMADANELAQEAMATMINARRTLRDARQKQHMVKQNRKYYQGANRGASASSSTTKPRDDSQIECLRCGVKGHRVAQCPHKPLSETRGQSHMAETGDNEPQQAPFVCYAEAFAGYASTAEPMSALSAEDSTRVDNRDPPVFTFGNSSENRCLSTARLQVTAGGVPGEMQIHTLEGGESPILMSIETLRKVGAIIDFQHDLAVFRHINPSRVLRLVRGKSGHQLLPLSEDCLSAARQTVSATQPRVLDYSRSKMLIPVSIAAIQAQIVVCNTTVVQPVGMDKMTQAQMVLSLRSYGEEPPKGWSKVQLLSRLTELEASGEITAPLPASKKATPLELAIKDLNKAGIRKATLQKYVTDECGIEITGNETMTILQQKAMTHLLMATDPVGEDKMGFGKYAAQTYATVKQNDPQYCSWATVTSKEGECSQYLRRFVKWLEMPEAKERAHKVDLNKIVPISKAKMFNKKPGTEDPTTGKGYPATTPTTSTSPTITAKATSSSAPDPMVQQLVQAVTALAKEVQDLKDDKAEKPRKIMAKADATMEEDAHQDGRSV
ncbi:unnamed protein product [Symbiodinium sp. CCMP2456]|nr:unnamed protein product [Symbiodinium sp. CCMP2456]